MRTLFIVLGLVIVTLQGWYLVEYHKQVQNYTLDVKQRDSFALAIVKCVIGREKVWLNIDKTIYEVRCKVVDQYPQPKEM
jgi:hypothetical protein